MVFVQNRIKTKGGKLFALFVDLKKAFDSVRHELLWNKLLKLGMSTKIINILANLYSKASLQVNTLEGMSNTCLITEGLLQGEVISPLMFALYISDIESFLEEEGIRGVSLNH